MSDIPELDRLIDDHAVFRANMAWDRHERIVRASLRVFVACLLTFVASMLTLGASAPLALVIGVATFAASFAALQRVVPNPPFRDPFKRYKYM